MLVLTRRLQESILIGTNIEIKILRICGHSVRIGVEAPVDIPIHRDEIYHRILDEKKGSLAALLLKQFV